MKTGIYGSRILLGYEKENTRRILKCDIERLLY